MSVTAGVLSAFVEVTITASTWGFGWLAAKAASVLVYFAVYTLMTKFSIDAKLHESKAISRSGIFYSVSDGVKSPTSLNEKSFADRFLQDSMAAALLGHPGGYYMTVTGGEPGNMYEGNLLVSPPRFGRLGNTNLLEDIGGFMRLLSDNLLNMGKSDSDAFTALDFDDTNLNYLLLTSELPSYNRYDYYTYYNTNDKASVYDAYSTNTLGFLESKIKRISNNQFDTIQPTIINGVPSYNFINSTLYQKILPQSILYKPIVLSESRYNQLTPGPGLLTITVQCKDFPSTKGIYAYGLLRLERHAGYKAKIPLKGKSFEYPIETISIDVISEGYMGEKNYLRHVRVDESYYTIEEGNLYFIKSLEEIISESYQEFEDSIEHDWLADFTGAYIYYDINIVFDRIIPDTTDETNSLALAQATFYTIMDYFNQYTYAQVSANMISEIAYTETLTFWSTLISVPLIYFGSAIATGAVGSLGAAAGSMLVKMVYSPMKEIIQEITEDAFIEVLAENFADMVGLSDDVGYWLSALGTSGRELGGSLRSASVSSSQSSQTDIALATAQNSGDANINLEMQNTLNENLQQQQQADLNQEQEKSQWKTLYQSKFFKGLMMVSTSLLLAPMTPTGLLAFAGIRTMVSGEIRNFGISRTKTQAYRKALVQYITKDHSTLAENIESQMKKPRNLDGEALNKLFRKSQGDGNTIDMPSIQTAPSISPNPKQIQRSNLFNKLKEISLFKGFSDIAFALEAFRMLYPEGYGGFNDPMLGLQAWGSDKGLDVSHLTFWGGIPYDVDQYIERLERIQANINELKNIRGIFNERLSRLEGTSSFLELQRLNEIMEEINNLDSNNLGDLLDKISKTFGSINWEVLQNRLNEIGEGDLQNNLEKRLYRLSLDNINPTLESFYPHDPSLVYPITGNEAKQTKALKTLINIIYKYQADLVIAARNTGNPLGLLFDRWIAMLNPSDLDPFRISNANLGRLLNKDFGTMGKWIANIESYKPDIKSLINLKLLIENSPFYNSIEHVQGLMILALNQFIFNDITNNLLYTYSKYSENTFSAQSLSEALGRSKNYIYKFKKTNTGVEEHTKFFRLLTIVFLADPDSFNLRDNNDYEKIKEEVLDDVFYGMIRKGMIKDKTFKLDFEALFYTVLTLTKAQMNTPNVKYDLYPLTLLATSLGFDRSFFTQKMLKGREITNNQVDQMKDAMDDTLAATLAPEFHQLAIDKLDSIIQRNGDRVKDDYIKYFWNYLYEIQIVEFLKITLGLDIWGREFIKDAELIEGKYKIDIERHHLEKIKSIYTMFKFSEDVDFSNNLIPFEDFVIALAPLMGTNHRNLDQSHGYNYNMKLAMHRLMHLYELIQSPFIEGPDYQSIFLNKFQSKIVQIDGNDVRIWEDFASSIKQEWINRWLKVKREGYEAFFLDEDKGYSNFYRFRYSPIERDYRLFLLGQESMNKNLFLSESMRNSFWRWFLSKYLRENVYPLM